MWVFLSDSFLSIVAHRTKPGVLLVRARVRGDIERAFPGTRAKRTPTADYLFRAEIPSIAVGTAIAAQVDAISYDNFKGSVSDPARHSAYMRVWSDMSAYQMRESVKAPRPARVRRRPAA